MKKTANSQLLKQSDLNRLNTLFAQIRSRLLYQRLINSITTGLLFSEIGGIIFYIFCFLFRDMDVEPVFFFTMILLIGIIGGLVPAIFNDNDTLEAEKRTDRFYSLENRFLTMSELLSRPDRYEVNPIVKLQIEDCLDCLPRIQPKEVVPIQGLPTFISVIGLLFIMTFITFLMIQSSPQADAKTPNETVMEIITELENDLHEPLKKMICENPDQENLKELDRQLVQLQKILEESCSDPEKSLSVLSQMEQEIQNVVDSFNMEATDQSFKDIGHALLNCQSTQKAAEALLEEDYETASSELEKIDFDAIKRQDREMLVQKLKNAAETIRQRKQNQLAQLTDQLAEELQEKKCASCKNTSCKLAGKCNSQKSNKELAQKLNCQLTRLGICKTNCAGACASCKNNCTGKESTEGTMAKGSSSGNQPGRTTASNPLGGTNDELQSTREQHQISGIQSDEGASVKEVFRTEQHRTEQIKTLSGDIYNTYKKQMESVLKNEDIPIDQRHIIRTYFESIRPKNNTKKAENNSTVLHENGQGVQ